MDFNSISQPAYERVVIMGVTQFKGDIDGQKIDSCTVFIATRFNEETGNAKGFGTAKVKFGTSANFARFNNVPFPTNAESCLKE